MSAWFGPLLDATSSAASTINSTPSHGSTNDSGIESSSGPSTPDSSPLVLPSYAHQAIESQIPQLCQPTNSALPDILNPETAANIPTRRICCIGAGYIGGPTAAIMALHNPSMRMTVVDRDEARLHQWKSRHLPIHEPGLQEVVRIARDGVRQWSIPDERRDSAGLDTVFSQREEGQQRPKRETIVPAREPNLFFSSATAATIQEADMIFLCVNTPTKTRGLGAGRATDLRAVEAATREIATHAKPGAIIVERSTVPCKTAQLIRNILETHRPGVRFEVLSNPEFLSEGTAVRNLQNPDRVIIGAPTSISGHRAAAALANLYAAWVPRDRITAINVSSSELMKLVANSMLAQRISSINSISAICERTGASVDEIAYAVGLDPRIGPQFLKAGLGFGGSCFRKDICSLVYLADSLGLPEVATYWGQVLIVNEFQRDRFVRKVIASLNNTLYGKKIAVLGFAFKKDTGDTRESPALDIIRTLLDELPDEIAIYDPCCSAANIQREFAAVSNDPSQPHNPGGPIEIYADPYQACTDASAILVLTDWDMFRNASAKPAKAASQQSLDPRPFSKLLPSETELMELQNFLASSYAKPTMLLDRYLPEPACIPECDDCRESNHATTTLGSNKRLDWHRIVDSVKEPKLVFDGRGILDAAEMQRIGFHVKQLGKIAQGV